MSTNDGGRLHAEIDRLRAGVTREAVVEWLRKHSHFGEAASVEAGGVLVQRAAAIEARDQNKTDEGSTDHMSERRDDEPATQGGGSEFAERLQERRSESDENAVRIQASRQRYDAALHGVQSAVAYEQAQRGLQPSADPDGPKHLRVGINSAHVSDDALVRLLVAKGVISEVEYAESLADAAEAELARYQARHPGLTFA